MRKQLRVPLEVDESVKSVSNELMINAYAEKADGVSDVIVRSHPGKTLFCAGGATYRGSIEIAETLYVVLGTALYTISSAGVKSSSLGSVGGTGYVTLDGNATNLTITNTAGDSYRYNGSAVTQITDPQYQAAGSVTYLNGTTIWSVLTGESFFWSSVDDGSSIDGLDVATAEFKPDKLRRAVVYRNDLLLFGYRSLEGWFDTGLVDAAYQRRGDMLVDVGLGALWSVAQINDTLFFLAHDGTIRMLDGASPVRISTESIERRINGDPLRGTSGWSDITLVRAFSYIYRGHLFVAFRHPDGCVEYDLTMKTWSIRTSASSTWRMVDSCFAYGQWVFFDASGNVYTQSGSSRLENSNAVTWQVVTPPMFNGGERFVVDQVDFVMDTGSGAITGAMTVERTTDGYSYATAKTASLGAAGERNKRVRIWGEGQAYQMAHRLTVTDDVPVTLSAIFANVRRCSG
jgi:hypothetical protein